MEMPKEVSEETMFWKDLTKDDMQFHTTAIPLPPHPPSLKASNELAEKNSYIFTQALANCYNEKVAASKKWPNRIFGTLNWTGIVFRSEFSSV